MSSYAFIVRLLRQYTTCYSQGYPRACPLDRSTLDGKYYNLNYIPKPFFDDVLVYKFGLSIWVCSAIKHLGLCSVLNVLVQRLGEGRRIVCNSNRFSAFLNCVIYIMALEFEQRGCFLMLNAACPKLTKTV